METRIPSSENPLPPTPGFGVRGTDEVYEYLSRIVEAMSREFGIPASEAHIRVDRHFRPYRWDFTDEDNERFLFEYGAEDWAGRIYFEVDPWRQEHAADWSRLRPRRVPEPGDPAFGGLALGEHPPPIVFHVAWDGELDVLASVVAGSRQVTGGRVARLENDRMTVKIRSGPVDPDRILSGSDPGEEQWDVSCEPEPDASWQDVSADLRAIMFRLRAAGLVCRRVPVPGRGNPIAILD
ncbi:hypothetical protein OG948_07175 [Embleya sp. NBC_00888]|uniref:hypothetical protein n=1 Tax=Embleya sp. NBC_00888 TaxID=2975960 RepID=UPI0038645552|nr:hypothetical protein OG948_07175 [Embleya sp. NBC_00888]